MTDAGAPAAVTTYRLTVDDGPELSVNIAIVSALRCRGDEKGVLRAVPLLDAGPGGPPENYTYQWSRVGGAAFATSQTVTRLGAGQFEVVIGDARGCTSDNLTTVTAPTAIDPRAIARDATCTGPDDGEVDLRPTGGTPASGAYDYVVTRPDGSIDNRRGPDLLVTGGPGAYAIEVVDANGCRQNTTQTVGAGRELAIAAVIDSVSCAGADDARVGVTLVEDFGGAPVPSYNFNWSGDARGGTDNTATDSEITGLAPGEYVLIATDDEGCEARETFTLSEPDVLEATLADARDETCDPGEDGFAEVRVTGGTKAAGGIYTYAWTVAAPGTDGTPAAGTPVSQDARAEGLSEAAYQVLVTDAHGCTDTLAEAAVIGAPAPPRITALEDFRVRCNGDADGVLEVLTEETTNPIDRIEWTGGRRGARIDGLAAGVYEVAVRDVAGCVATGEAVVEEPGVLAVAAASVAEPACFQQGGGSIALTLSGGTGPFTFAWSDGTAGVGASAIGGDAITAGSYVVEVTDANACPTLTEVYTLADAPSIDPAFRDFRRASCALVVCDGGVTVEAELPGSPGARFDFAWDSGETTDDALVSSAAALCGGRNAVFIRETSGVCPAQEFPVDIPAPDPIVAAFDTTDVRCFGESSGRIDVTSTVGGVPEYRYTWTTPAGQRTGTSVVDLTAGTTYLDLRDEDDCPYLDTFYLREPAELTVTNDDARTVHPRCFGNADGEIYLTVAGGNTGARTLRWNDDPSRDRTDARDLVAGTYVAQVTDREGCADEVTVVLTQPEEIRYDFLPYAPIRCFGEFTFVRLASVTGGTGQVPEDYQVSLNGSTFSPVGQEFQVPGGRPLSVVVTDPEGCEAVGELLVEEPPAISARLPEVLEVQLGDSVRLRPSLIAGGAPLVFDSLRWTPDSTLFMYGESGRVNPYAKPLSTTTYTLLIGDEDGCTAEASVEVRVDRKRNVFIPTAFSPNNDAVNDQLQIFTGPGVEAIERVAIYDRWGELVYEALDLPTGGFGQTVGWDGNFRGRLVDAGAYVYIAEIRFLDGAEFTYKGSVTVVY